MSYTISYLRRGRDEIGSERWQRGLEEAKAHAKKAVLVGTAERAEIRDESGALVFHYPRITERARP
jgi:hypothetical protein